MSKLRSSSTLRPQGGNARVVYDGSFVCPHPYPIPPPISFFFVFYMLPLISCPPSRNFFLENPRGNVKNVFLLILAMPFFVTLPFCVASVAVRSCFRFYSLSLLHPEKLRVFYLFCLAFLSSSRRFYRLSFYCFIVLSRSVH